jgi:hypothetical protein
MNKSLNFPAQFQIMENVEFVLRDKFGNVKKLFQENKIYTKLMKMGVLSPFAYQKLGIFDFLLGKWSESKLVANLMTNAGFAGMASRCNGAGSEAAFTYIGIGTGTTAANVADTTLETEITTGGGARANSTASRVTTTVTNDTAQLVNTFTFTAGFAVTESGVLNAASSGVLLCRQVFSAINVVSGDTLQITWKIKNAAS